MKVLLIPLAVLAFIAFLLILGAIGLGISFLVLAVLGKAFRVVFRTGKRSAA
jgi:hypothetical protein